MGGLFLYDIFWVFGTEVMVKVATGVKGPIKFIFPKVLPAPADYTREAFSILGLGDVVVPGFFIAMLLAFDAYNARKEGVDTTQTVDWKKPYFHTCMVFYALALLTTVVVMLVFKHAQVCTEMMMMMFSLIASNNRIARSSVYCTCLLHFFFRNGMG